MPTVTNDGTRCNLRSIPIAIVLAALAVPSAFGQENVASSNTVSGVIRIFDRDGNELADRSDVVIFIDGLSDSVPYQSVTRLPQVSHKDRQFSPNVLPLVRGTSVDFFNDDNIFHNVFSLSKPKSFDLGIYPEGTSKLVTFSDPGLVKIHCNIHPRMTSTILVLNNSLFATTGPDGKFQIDGVPDGQLTLRIWHEFSEEQSRVVTLSGGRLEESFDVHETKRFIQHRNKFGKRYPDKY